MAGRRGKLSNVLQFLILLQLLLHQLLLRGRWLHTHDYLHAELPDHRWKEVCKEPISGPAPPESSPPSLPDFAPSQCQPSREAPVPWCFTLLSANVPSRCPLCNSPPALLPFPPLGDNFVPVSSPQRVMFPIPYPGYLVSVTHNCPRQCENVEKFFRKCPGMPMQVCAHHAKSIFSTFPSYRTGLPSCLLSRASLQLQTPDTGS